LQADADGKKFYTSQFFYGSQIFLYYSFSNESKKIKNHCRGMISDIKKKTLYHGRITCSTQT
jgi:hypothetical protein